jgi:predicted Zn-dependent peptidase
MGRRTRKKKIESVTAEQTRAALVKYKDPAKLTIVAAGSFATTPTI